MHRVVQVPGISCGAEALSHAGLVLLQQLADDGAGGTSPAGKSTCPNARPSIFARCVTQDERGGAFTVKVWNPTFRARDRQFMLMVAA